METLILYIPYIPAIFLAVVGSGLIAFCWWYHCLRARWHRKGILPYNYDGTDPKQNPNGETLFDTYRKEREYDRRMKETEK